MNKRETKLVKRSFGRFKQIIASRTKVVVFFLAWIESRSSGSFHSERYLRWRFNSLGEKKKKKWKQSKDVVLMLSKLAIRHSTAFSGQLKTNSASCRNRRDPEKNVTRAFWQKKYVVNDLLTFGEKYWLFRPMAFARRYWTIIFLSIDIYSRFVCLFLFSFFSSLSISDIPVKWRRNCCPRFA